MLLLDCMILHDVQGLSQMFPDKPILVATSWNQVPKCLMQASGWAKSDKIGLKCFDSTSLLLAMVQIEYV